MGHQVAMSQEVGEEEEEGSSHDLEEGLRWAIIKTVNTAKLRTRACTHTHHKTTLPSLTHSASGWVFQIHVNMPFINLVRLGRL